MDIKNCSIINQALQKCCTHLKEQKPYKTKTRDYFGFPLEITIINNPLNKIRFKRIINDSNYVDINYLKQKIEEFLNLKIEVNIIDSSYYVDVIFDNDLNENQNQEKLSFIPLYLSNPSFRKQLENLRDNCLSSSNKIAYYWTADDHRYYVIPKTSFIKILIELPFSKTEKDDILISVIAKEISRNTKLNNENIKIKYELTNQQYSEISDNFSFNEADINNGLLNQDNLKYGYLSIFLHAQNVNTEKKINSVIWFVLSLQRQLKMYANALKVNFHAYMRKKTDTLIKDINSIKI